MENEKRLIDANDLWHKTFVCEEPGDFRKVIENATTVDAVEVVRCKDCRHSILPELMTAECTYWHEVVGINGFCHHGERRTDNG